MARCYAPPGMHQRSAWHSNACGATDGFQSFIVYREQISEKGWAKGSTASQTLCKFGEIDSILSDMLEPCRLHLVVVRLGQRMMFLHLHNTQST